MSFPNHDPYWTAVADYLETRTDGEAAVLAPDLFWRRFPTVFRYLNTHLDPTRAYDWVVAHKGELAGFSHRFLERLRTDYRPAFANPVFVVLTRAPVEAEVDGDDVQSLWEGVERTLETPEQAAGVDDFLPGQGQLTRLASLNDADFRTAMNAFWLDGGYLYTTLRDQTYSDELDHYLSKMIGAADAQVVLDLCCGSGRLKNILVGAESVVGIDVSDVAIEMAKAAHADADLFTFRQMDAHRLDFADEAFDLVVFADAIEHVMRIDEVFAEVRRVLKPGGRMFLTVASRDSVPEFMSRKLGFGEFMTNHHHIREFGYAETCDMLAKLDFRILESGGMLLYPYWGIPGVDDVVRHLTDEDPETVQLFRDLGRKVGAEHAYSFVLLLEKAAV